MEVEIDKVFRDIQSRHCEMQLYDPGGRGVGNVPRPGGGQRGVIAQTRSRDFDVAPGNLEDPELGDTLLFPRGWGQ